MSFVDLSRFLNEELQNPIVRADKKLQLWCLIAKGYTDIEIDYRAAKRDWLEAQEIANALGENQWGTRASGELGLVAFLEGNPGRAARLLGSALLSTMASGDTGGQIRFLELIGRGFEEVNRHTEALRFFERAIKLADAEKDCGLPFMAYEGKARALVALGKPDEAKTVLEDALGKARSQQKRGHEAEVLILLGKLASQAGDRNEAIADLESAGQFAKRVQFFRMEADAMFELATMYRDAGDQMCIRDRTTLLRILADFIPDQERLVVIEDTSELQIRKPNIVAAECQTDTFKANISFDKLLKSALRWRPDRIIMGEVRGICLLYTSRCV